MAKHARPKDWAAKRRRLQLTTLVVVPALAGVGLSVATSEAAEQPQRVLQSVDVDLGTDGTLYALTSSNLRKHADGSTSSDTVTLDPTKLASDLPVRVLTSWAHDGKTGTDLSQLKGAKGRVVVTVTVQNTTVHPELLTYDVAGEKRSRYALIGTPLTVVASASLGKDSLDKVVQATSGDTTNGVLSRTTQGETKVQWSALLAPPRLASSATFTLVEDAASFHLPHLDLSVQPGLATDPSVQQLLNEVFSQDGAGRLSLERKTVQLITSVDTVLSSATTVLGDIQRNLASSAATLGDKAIGDLRSSSDNVATEVQGLVGDLGVLSDSLTRSVNDGNASAIGQLAAGVEKVKAFLGDPAAVATPLDATTTAGGCVVGAAADAPDKTVYGQLRKVSGQLTSLAASTGGCRDSIVASLDATIGDLSQLDACTPASTSALCALKATRGQLDGVSTFLATKGSALLTAFDPTAVDKVQDALDALTSQVELVRGLADKVRGKKTAPALPIDDLAAGLTTLAGNLDTAAAGLTATSATGLGKALADLNKTAAARVKDLSVGDGSVTAQAQALADAVCDAPALPVVPTETPSATPTETPTETPSPTPTETGTLTPLGKSTGGGNSPDQQLQDYLDNLRGLLTGTSCGTHPSALPVPSSFSAPLLDRIVQDASAWQTVVQSTDLAHPTTGAAKEAASLRTTLTGLAGDARALAATVSDPTTGISKKLSTLLDKVTALSSGTAPGACPSVTEALPALDALQLAFGRLSCNQKDVRTQLGQLLATATPTYAAAATTLDATSSKLDTARRNASSALGVLIGQLNTGLTTSATSVVDEGGAVITDQRTGLDRELRDFTQQLDTTSQQTLGTITKSVGLANDDLNSSKASLQDDLSRVLTDLGERTQGGGGLLGVIAGSATRTAQSTSQVGGARATASAFQGVRSAEVDELFLQQRQLQRGLELEEQLKPLGLTLPAGSTHAAVYNLHLRAV